MRALIFSDSHGDEEILRWMAELMSQRGPVDAYVHCGDGAQDFERVENYLLALSPRASIYGVRGNCDYFVNDVPWQRVMRLGGVNVLITHGHLQGVKTTLSLLPSAAREMGCAETFHGYGPDYGYDFWSMPSLKTTTARWAWRWPLTRCSSPTGPSAT